MPNVKETTFINSKSSCSSCYRVIFVFLTLNNNCRLLFLQSLRRLMKNVIWIITNLIKNPAQGQKIEIKKSKISNQYWIIKCTHSVQTLFYQLTPKSYSQIPLVFLWSCTKYNLKEWNCILLQREGENASYALKVITSDAPIKCVHAAADRFLKKMFFGCVVCEQVCVRADLLLCCLSLSLASIILARSRDTSSSLKSDKNIDKSDLWSSWWIL